jgi:hypothetical protein
MKKTSRIFPVALLSMILLMQGCKDHDDVVNPVNEVELLTTMRLSFAKWDELGIPSQLPVEFIWRDEDGSGNPEIEVIELEPNATYTLNISVLDESKVPAIEITNQIMAEADKHQFFFELSPTDVLWEYHDSDANAQPVGLETIFITGEPETGLLTVILRHEPNKSAEGVQDGDITNAGGETDIQAEFPITIAE